MDPIRLGYACINTKLQTAKIFCNHSCIMGTLLKMTPEEAVQHCQDLALQNVSALLQILEWNEARGIRLFRITSTLFPHCGNHLLPPTYRRKHYFQGDIEFARPMLEAVGAYARKMGHRLTFHAQPVIQLGTPNPHILLRTIFDLNLHAKIFQMLKTESPVLIMHGGGVYQEHDMTKNDAKQKTMKRWITQWSKLQPALRNCIVIENDERHYGVADLLPICEQNGIPFCFDVFHNSISADRVPVTSALLRRIKNTWKGARPKFHVSDQWKGQAFGSHAEYVKEIPDYLLQQRGIDIMIEAKMKEQAVLRLYKKHFDNRNNPVRWSPKK